MPIDMVVPDSARVMALNAGPVRNEGFVLYWMQAAQRTRANPALNYTAALANRLAKPLAVCFRLRTDVPGANARHYAFMLEGLADTAKAIADMGAVFVVLTDRDPDALAAGAAAAVTDCGHLAWQVDWRRRMADAFPCRLIQVETETAVPVDLLSPKEEYAAASLRPKLHRLIGSCLDTPLAADTPPALQTRATPRELRLPEWAGSLPPHMDKLPIWSGISHSAAPVRTFGGGEREAWRRLSTFISDKLARYAADGNNPTHDVCSGLSPYLHFGQISPLASAREILSHCSSDGWPPIRRPVRGGDETAARDPLLASRDNFLEQLLVRRELAINFVTHNQEYDQYAAIPAWAKRSLERHRPDRRQYVYTEGELENAATHDRYWNAAQRQMVETGHMHNYMRMYWGKKVIEWTRDPEDAFHILMRQNDTYQLDGRDANGTAGIAWCFGKHDRPWKERAIFGQVRYMNAAGLERKFEMDGYVEQFSKHNGDNT